MCRNGLTLVLAALVCGGVRAADDPPGFKGTVLLAVDAGTLQVRPDGEKKAVTVKLIGLSAPVKATRDTDGQEPWAARGQQALAVLVARKEVRVEYDVLKSEAGRTSVWGHVWVKDKDGKEQLVNEAVLAGGHAVLETRAPNVKYVERLTAAQKAAREAKKNIWDEREPLTETPAEYAKKAADKKPDVATLEKWVEGCVIGNKKSKKYHVTGGQYYNSSKDSPNAVFFKTEEDAKKAGYEKSAR